MILFRGWLAGVLVVGTSWLPAALPARAQTAPLELRPGARIAIVGNTLADRMQHFGHLEALVQARFPGHQLVVRNLGFSGDELTTRLRSAGFGSPDDHLAFVQADVVLAFFGYNESFAGGAGLARFKHDLREFVDHTRAQKYNGKSPPRLVLFSPIGHEDLSSPDLPDGSANNERLEQYTQAMREVAAEAAVPFVDLFHSTLAAYRADAEPHTINGVHLNDHGYRQLAEQVATALFGPAAPPPADHLERIRQAVLDKDFHWFSRYRTTDGYSIYGGRADLKFVNGQTNREVAQRELQILNEMTIGRDRRVWAVAQGGDKVVDDSGTALFVEVISNLPGPLPGGKHKFLGGEEAIGKMTVAKGMKVNLVASEEQFPELVNPVQMAFDTKGRLWVAAWDSYPHWKPKDKLDDKLLILEDNDGDGRADKCITFAGGLHNPTGFEFWNGGVLIAQAPDLVFLKDTDGDDRADVRSRVLSGLDSADTHHTANSFALDPSGALYFQEGTFHHTQVETPYGPPVRLANAGVFRYEPRTQKFDVYVSYGFANPHGHAFDDWGQDIVVDGTGAVPFHAALFSGHVDFPQKHPAPPAVYKQRTRPCPGIEYLSSSHFPEELQGNLLVGNVIGFQGILQYRVHDQGASFGASEGEPIVASSDPNFRPADFEIGPDGALYFTDWHNPIIGHMQHNLRDPNRDRTHGRVYRVTYEGRPLSKSPPIAGEPIEKLLDVLKEPELRVRHRARIELGGRDSAAVMIALGHWVRGLDGNDPRHEHHLLEALWLGAAHNRLDQALLERMLAAKDFLARAAAARVLCYQRERVSDALARFRELAADEHPRVRLEAVRAASFFTVPEAVEIPLVAAELPEDEYLKFVRAETMKTLDPYWKRALADGRPIGFTTDAGQRYWLENVSNEQLLKMDRTAEVCRQMLVRPGLLDDDRRDAVRRLAQLQNESELRVAIDALAALDAAADAPDQSLVFDLIRQLTGRPADELATARAELEKLATTARQGVLRQIGFAALVNVDRSADAAWQLAGGSLGSLCDFVEALPLVADGSIRASLYERIVPLAGGVPGELSASAASRQTPGRFVRIELPKRGTLTLAEVEVVSGGRNVAPAGRARQKNTAHGGDAQRAIDGNKGGAYGGGGQTHSEENTNHPWWEVDLGAELPIEAVTIYNRTDGDLGARLNGFTLKVLDAERNVTFRREGAEAPRESVTLDVGTADPAARLREAAMLALTHVRGQEARTFELLAPLVANDRDRAAAIRALRRLRPDDWPKERADGVLQVVVAYLAGVPLEARTAPAALDALEFGHALCGLLPPELARQRRARLRELGVLVVRVGTLFERMAYDKDVLVVGAGKPVEFVFENSDLMPHNFVIVRPGTLEAIGGTAERTAQDPAAAARHYVPDSPDVLLASTLVQPRASEKLGFTAPGAAGVYPYVCTYPGHWRRMYGALYVVDDLDAYLESPESYLAAHPLEINDALLKDRRPRTEWTFDDLAAAVGEMGGGRSYGNGKQLFQVASCVACHKLDGAGNAIGPDLAQLDAKFKSLDVLQELLDPSARINEKFQSYVFQLNSGRVVTGLVVDETPAAIKVLENPLVAAEPVPIAPRDVEERLKSSTSLMPKGLLEKLSREEILDLIAYVLARGNANDPLFQRADGHDHDHGGH